MVAVQGENNTKIPKTWVLLGKNLISQTFSKEVHHWSFQSYACLSSPQTNNVQNTQKFLPKGQLLRNIHHLKVQEGSVLSYYWQVKHQQTVSKSIFMKICTKSIFMKIWWLTVSIFTQENIAKIQREREMGQISGRSVGGDIKMSEIVVRYEEGIIGEPETELLYVSDMDVS